MSSKISLLFIAIFIYGCASSNKPPVKSVADKKADLYYSHGTQMLVDKDYTSALMHLQNAYKFRSDDTKILNNLGMAYYFKNDIESAIKYLKMAIDEDEDNSDARNNLASIFVNKKRYTEAMEQYQKIKKNLIYKHQYRTHYNIALIYKLRGNTDAAVSELQKSVQIRKDYCPAFYQLGVIATKQRRFRKSIDFFKKSTLGSCVNNPAPHYQQALSLLELDLQEQAFLKLKEVIEQFPTSRYSILATRKLRAVQVEQLRSQNRKMSDRRINKNKKTNNSETRVSF